MISMTNPTEGIILLLYLLNDAKLRGALKDLNLILKKSVSYICLNKRNTINMTKEENHRKTQLSTKLQRCYSCSFDARTDRLFGHFAGCFALIITEKKSLPK